MVTATVLEIFYQDYCTKALLLVTATVLEIFYQDYCTKALLLVTATVLEHQNKAEFENLINSEVITIDFLGLRTSAASVTSTASVASMTSTASFHQKNY